MRGGMGCGPAPANRRGARCDARTCSAHETRGGRIAAGGQGQEAERVLRCTPPDTPTPGAARAARAMGTDGGKRAHRLRPRRRVFQAEVSRGSWWTMEPERFGPTTIQRCGGRRCSATRVNRSSRKISGMTQSRRSDGPSHTSWSAKSGQKTVSGEASRVRCMYCTNQSRRQVGCSSSNSSDSPPHRRLQWPNSSCSPSMLQRRRAPQRSASPVMATGRPWRSKVRRNSSTAMGGRRGTRTDCGRGAMCARASRAALE